MLPTPWGEVKLSPGYKTADGQRDPKITTSQVNFGGELSRFHFHNIPPGYKDFHSVFVKSGISDTSLASLFLEGGDVSKTEAPNKLQLKRALASLAGITVGAEARRTPGAEKWFRARLRRVATGELELKAALQDWIVAAKGGAAAMRELVNPQLEGPPGRLEASMAQVEMDGGYLSGDSDTEDE